MGTMFATLPIEEGVKTPMYLIDLPYLPDSSINGKFFYECAVTDW